MFRLVGSSQVEGCGFDLTLGETLRVGDALGADLGRMGKWETGTWGMELEGAEGGGGLGAGS